MDVVVVGPCGAGKTTLVATLAARGYAARAVAQEHSAVPELWRHGGTPAALVLLDAARTTIMRRRGADFPDWLLARQQERLASARAHADLTVPTDAATPEDVAAQVIRFLRSVGIPPVGIRDA